MASIKAEFRKLLTVRSTYIISGLAMLLVIFYAGFIEGYKADALKAASPSMLSNEITGAIGAVAVIAALIGVLLVAHEYRYSTIMYTLTASNSRSKSLFAKWLAITVYIVIFTVIVGVLSPVAATIGLHIKGTHLADQVIYFRDIAWRVLFYGWGYSMLGMLFALLFRNVVGAVVGLFLLPGTVETLLGLLLKHNQVYLPATSLNAVIQYSPYISYTKAALVFMAYVIGGGFVAWILFLRRDAN